MVDQFKVRMADPVRDVLFPAREEVINDRDLMSVDHQRVDEMRTDKAGATCDLPTTKQRVENSCVVGSGRMSEENVVSMGDSMMSLVDLQLSDSLRRPILH